MGEIRGYKVFNPDWTCRNFQYEVGKVFEEEVKPVCCEVGFHFCLSAADCFSYYSSHHDNKVAEVIALGEVDYSTEDSKCATNKLQIVREIGWDEVQKIANLGKNCTGVCNTGNCNAGNWNTGNGNAGNWNTGNCNTGNWNTGNGNAGNWNTGNGNAGNRNTGDGNAGNRNTGDRNTEDCNTGSCNAGNCNTGNWNTGNGNAGNWNTGNCNAGNCNTGNWNTGNRNTGDGNAGNRNTGDRNTGNCNTGDGNAGDWNRSSFNTGCFMTEEQKISMFNKRSDWTYQDWLHSEARRLLNRIPKNVVGWVHEPDMTDEEKAAHPTFKTTNGYLKVSDESERGQIWWDGLKEDEKNVIRALPNFDPEIFSQCTGINPR